ncbi:MFS transporter [Levilactobacillus fujinensis]|uniref:MFS transporter n=1 Tax=Levilactobacillus fujinensis TaxID=2486024 RepID=A0ABW1TH07_9LACO|nr:MFS transporter [Levilactobacillus fujinensis]
MLKVLVPFALVNLFYGAADAGLPRFARVYLSRQAWGYGALLTGIAVGGLLGALLVQKLRLTGNRLITFAGGCLILGGGCRLLLVVSRQGGLAVLLISVSALFVSMMNINFIAYVQSAFPSEILGRISTINESLLSAMIPFGSVLGGVMVTHWAVIWPQVLYGGVTVLTGMYFLVVIQHAEFD